MAVTSDERAGPTIALTGSGRAIHVDPSDPRAARLMDAHGDFNPLSRVLWHRALRLRPWDTVVDVGANYGEMLVDAPVPDGARIIAFEPNVALHPYLRRTCAEAGVAVELRPEAVADRTGAASFAVDAEWSGTSTLVPPADPDPARWRTTEVPVTTLDAVLAGPPTAGSWCAKVDVEGAELAVLAGAADSTDPSRPWALMVEVLHLPSDELARLAERFPAYLLDRRTHDLVPVLGGHARLARQMLGSGWLYPQDCLLVSPALVREGRP